MQVMVKIKLTNVGKRFNREWIFRHFSYEFSSGISYAITGPNGSGKSTLLQVIAASTIINEGKIEYLEPNTIPDDKIFSHVSIAAPYLELVEEMTLTEFFSFHSSLKKWLPSFTTEKIISEINLDAAAGKQIRYFSSGMRQRVKLAQAIFSDVPVILLDEPCTNLDADGIALYRSLINNYCNDRLLLVSSNDRQEYYFCKEVIDMRDIK